MCPCHRPSGLIRGRPGRIGGPAFAIDGIALLSGRGAVEEARRRWVRWTKKERTVFLDHLAATGSVCEAAAIAEVSTSSVYRLRRKDEAFAEAWRKALILGYEMLETVLLGHVLAGGGSRIQRPDGRTIDLGDAMRLLSMHRAHRQGDRKRGGRPLERARPEDTDAAILRKLAAIDRARALEAEEARAQ